MSKKNSQTESVFQIEIAGKTNTSLFQFMDDYGFRIDDEQSENTFIGWLPDQTALLGLLAGLTDLHYQIKSVRNLLK